MCCQIYLHVLTRLYPHGRWEEGGEGRLERQVDVGMSAK